MVLEGAMKRVLSILLGSVVTFILGTLLLAPITTEIYYTNLISTFRLFIQPMISKFAVSNERNSQ